MPYASAPRAARSLRMAPAPRSVQRRIGRHRRQERELAALAAQHRRPEPLGLVAEQLLAQRRLDDPGLLGQLVLELAGSPARRGPRRRGRGGRPPRARRCRPRRRGRSRGRPRRARPPATGRPTRPARSRRWARPARRRTRCRSRPRSSSRSGTASATAAADGRFSTSPIAPSSVCSVMNTTARSKFGSLSSGPARRSLPRSESITPAAGRGRARSPSGPRARPAPA